MQATVFVACPRVQLLAFRVKTLQILNCVEKFQNISIWQFSEANKYAWSPRSNGWNYKARRYQTKEHFSILYITSITSRPEEDLPMYREGLLPWVQAVSSSVSQLFV